MAQPQHSTINDIPQRDAETKHERLLLGLLNQEAERMGFGSINLELTVRAGRIDRAKITEMSRIVNIGSRDG